MWRDDPPSDSSFVKMGDQTITWRACGVTDPLRDLAGSEFLCKHRMHVTQLLRMQMPVQSFVNMGDRTITWRACGVTTPLKDLAGSEFVYEHRMHVTYLSRSSQ